MNFATIGVLSARQTAELLPFHELVDAIRVAVAEVSEQRILCPERQALAMTGGAMLLSMAATAADIAVHKLVSVVPANAKRGLPTIQGQVSVISADTGECLLTLDGATVTGRRTAALSMLGIATLLAEAPRQVLIFGTGTQASHHVRAIAALYPFAQVRVAGHSASSTLAFCAAHLKDCPSIAPAIDFIAADGIDLVITCTSSRQPVYAEKARASRLLIAIGAFSADAAEIAPDTVRASRIYVDDLQGAHHEAGDLILAGVNWGQVQPLSRVFEVGSPHDVPVLFKTVGCAAWDLAAARVARNTMSTNGSSGLRMCV